MKPGRIIAMGVAVTALSLGMLMLFKRPPKVEVREVRVEAQSQAIQDTQNVTEVLVAAEDFQSGRVFSAGELKWVKWPIEAVHASFITKDKEPKAIEEYAGAISRSQFVAGEPIRANKIVKSGSKNNFMAVLVNPGMRAVAIPLSPETGAGGFILPNDKVDVIMVRRVEIDPRNRVSSGQPDHESSTVLTDIRVLAVDQVVEDKNGEKTVLARTATLELGPQQAETLALANKLGTVSLSLRPLNDSKKDAVVASEDADGDKNNPFMKKEGSSLKVIKFGVNTGNAQ